MWKDIAKSLGIFDTLVPIASIATIMGITTLILPRHGGLGFFFLLWWFIVVMISLQEQIFQDPYRWKPNIDWKGMIVLIGLPLTVLWILIRWFQTKPSIRICLLKDCPLWCMFAIHIYRLDGLSILWLLQNGTIPKFLGYQILVLDVWMGLSSILLVILTYQKGVNAFPNGRRIRQQQQSWRRNLLWFWNSLGLYDLISGYILLLLNFMLQQPAMEDITNGGSGGEEENEGRGGFRFFSSFATSRSTLFLFTDPPLSIVGFHPIPLIVLFQAPLAMGIHILMLTSMDIILQKQGSLLPLHTRIEQIRGGGGGGVL